MGVIWVASMRRAAVKRSSPGRIRPIGSLIKS